MAVHILTLDPKFGVNKNLVAKIETTDMKFLERIRGYTVKGQTREIKLEETEPFKSKY
jgi:hypothetical protein